MCKDLINKFFETIMKQRETANRLKADYNTCRSLHLGYNRTANIFYPIQGQQLLPEADPLAVATHQSLEE